MNITCEHDSTVGKKISLFARVVMRIFCFVPVKWLLAQPVPDKETNDKCKWNQGWKRRREVTSVINRIGLKTSQSIIA